METSNVDSWTLARSRTLWPVAAAVFFLVGCEQAPSPETEPEPVEPAAVDPRPVEDLMETTILLHPVNGSGVSGEALALQSDGAVVVAVDLMGLPDEGEYQAHIHRGVCSEGGPVAVGLNPVIGLADGTGSSTTTLDMEELQGEEGDFFVQVHGETGIPISCGDAYPGEA